MLKAKLKPLFVLALAFFSLVWILGGPVGIYYSHVDHEGSRAYERRSYSEMGRHWIRVCDRNPFYTERGVAGVAGRNVVVRDTMDSGCGYREFDRTGKWHKTCSVNQCGGRSYH